MGNLSRAPSALLLLLSMLVLGCSSPVDVVKKATPNPFAAGAEPHFVLVRFDWSELQVDGRHVDEYLAELDASDRESFEADRRDAEGAFSSALVKAGRDRQVRVVRRDPDGSGYAIRVLVERFSPPGEIELLVTIEDPDGNALDVVRLGQGVVMSTRTMERYADLLAVYLGGRVRP